MSRVSLTFPAETENIAIARTTAAAMAARCDLTIDQVEDVRLAVDEAVSQLILVAPGSQITCEFTARTGELGLLAWSDAAAYGAWAGKELPTEAEHEYAARGGLEGKEFAWGDELAPNGQMLANYWQGLFPFANTREDGWERTSPVRSYSPNGYGLYDMVGNVWEWTADWWSEHPAAPKKKHDQACCTISNPRGGKLRDSFDPAQPEIRIGRKVLKGGSHLCAVNHCQRFRPAARHPEMIDTATSHIGFRCMVRPLAAQV